MAKKNLKEQLNTGFGNSNNTVGSRLINKDGSANIVKSGLPFWKTNSTFHTMIRVSWWKFILLTFIIFLLCNLVFTIIYYLLGVHQLNGITASSSFEKFAKVYFFSVQTFTTVGYGHISPNTISTSAVSAIEAFCGLLFFALVTGLLYARFSIPKAFIKFSDCAIIAPYENITGLMFRMAPFKNNNLIDAEVKLSLSLVAETNGKMKTEFYIPKLEIDRVNSLVLSWTIVHPIAEDSPIYGFTKEDFANKKFELLVFVKAFDESYSSTVVARTSYRYDELKCGYKFETMYQRSDDGSSTILHLDKLNQIKEINLS